MDAFSESLNELLEKAFRSVLKIEEQMLNGMGQLQLSINEIHLLEAVGKGGDDGKMISELANDLQLTPPSVTIAVKKLESKGLLEKKKGVRDARTVSITLTEQGQKVDRVHRRFHERMVGTITADMSGAEKEVLLLAITKLNKYFDAKITPKQ